MHIRPATREDIEAFSSVANKPTLKAWAGVVDGRVVALGGIAFSHGRWTAFCDLEEEARKYKMTIMRTAKRGLREIKDMGIRFVYAEANTEEPGAIAWLASLGFMPDERSGSLWRWRA